MKCLTAALILTIACATPSLAQTTVVPTTTLAAETANNTSASSTWSNTTTGDAVAGNVSQVDVHSLLYAGETTKVYAHYLGWWGPGGGHIDNGTNSATLAQAHATITDMMNRGIDGLIIDWYGAGNTHINQASLYIEQDAETRAGKFTFAIMEDQGAVRTCAETSGCNATQAVINDLTYINSTYASSPAYMRINGRPVIFTFDTEDLPNINWTTVMASVPGNPMIVLRNDGGFRYWFTSGSYSWVSINTSNPNDWGQNYLDDFYATSRSYPNELVYAGVWKGFNDNLASWGSNRVVNQNCGQTWLNTFDEMNKYFSATNQPQAVQLVTWNDYEEGTEIETGIDNCVSVSGSMSGSMLEWSISGGEENTIDHYTVFVSLDGQSLMPLANVASGTHQLDLSTFKLSPANYTLYVKAIGKPAMLNKMSEAVLFTQAAPPAPFTITPVMPLNGATVGQSVHFMATASSPGSTVSALRIYVDNVSMYTVDAASLNTTLQLAAGSHYVVLQGWNAQGQVAKSPMNITVQANQPPVATLNVTPGSGIGPLMVTAAVSASDASGTITATSINFGDGMVANGVSASHMYNSSGTFTVTATVTDSNGLTTTATAAVSVAGVDVTLSRPERPVQGTTAPPASTQVAATPPVTRRVSADSMARYNVNLFRSWQEIVDAALALSEYSEQTTAPVSESREY